MSCLDASMLDIKNLPQSDLMLVYPLIPSSPMDIIQRTGIEK
jgi:hypothetical protein